MPTTSLDTNAWTSFIQKTGRRTPRDRHRGAGRDLRHREALRPPRASFRWPDEEEEKEVNSVSKRRRDRPPRREDAGKTPPATPIMTSSPIPAASDVPRCLEG